MQELLGRIAALDPGASLALRVIACFDELVVGNVNTRALLGAAASLSGCEVGFHQAATGTTMRVCPRGELARDRDAPPPGARRIADGLCVWLDRDGAPHANDEIILERLGLALRIRYGRDRQDTDLRRDLGQLLDPGLPLASRRQAATALGLHPGRRYRVVAAPLFAVWTEHPGGIEDVVATPFGTIHASVVPADGPVGTADPSGVGVAADVDHLHTSFTTALVALRLCERPTTTTVSADDFGGLVSVLATMPPDAEVPDVELVDAVTAFPWGRATLDALVRAGTVRQAARLAGVHHSTMQSRVETVAGLLGFDPFDGLGRTRLGLAYLVWRLRHSRVLDLPAPT
ncbi:helix-turn-helix domain-containing protein [Actinomycetospora soli]|uniref:helix-turn-helix domain-containing protein n=1 Tax=Actinomycetospora soli TaxID=2893887 RepID=UPI001E492DD9|nr:helix-turn-helix domain-containing protein [Actinomycetospora soli]MCD2188997.1 helix-turn-helix domain-containing protein [Actinomycetospora soli]